MAELLSRQWHLAVLKVRLDVTQRTPAVVSEMISYAGDQPQSLWTRRDDLEQFGLAESAGPPHQLTMPPALRDQIASTLHGPLNSQSSLWLRLVPPYGYLGAVPWEGQLLQVTQIPLLRVPNRLPRASDPGRQWSVAICVSTPAVAGQRDSWSGAYLQSLAHSLRQSTQCDIDVFADSDTVNQLRALGVNDSAWMHIHEPRTAASASVSRSSRRDPVTTRPLQRNGQIWVDWIMQGLAGRAIRALHVVLDATWDGDRAVLSVGTDPALPADPDTCRFVTAADVSQVADLLGGATLSFGSPPGARSDTAVRMIADSLGQQRPGATLYSSISADPMGLALAAAHAFIAGQGPPEVPAHPSLFAYLQPSTVRPALLNAWPSPSTSGPRPQTAEAPLEDPLPDRVIPPGYDPEPGSALDQYYADADTVPSWAAAAERYVGSQIAHLSQPGDAPGSVPDKKAYEQGATEALAEIQNMIAKYARPS